MATTPTTPITCQACGSAETIRVELELSGGFTAFTTCSICEWKGWERDGELLTLDSVLDIVSAR